MRKQIARGSEVPKTETEVGIFYLVAGKLYFDCTPLSEAPQPGCFKIHERSHFDFWHELASAGKVPLAEFGEYARGRVACHVDSGKFLLLADDCILSDPQVVTRIMGRMHLPANSTENGWDPLYWCLVCSRRKRKISPQRSEL